MEAKFLILVLASVAQVALLCIEESVGSFQGFLCPDEEVTVFDGVTFPTAIIPCNYDCVTNHNSSQGSCTSDGNYNCLCSGIFNQTRTPPTILTPFLGQCTYFNSYFNVTRFCHCSLNSPLTEPVFKFACENDCKCNHGAYHGTCDYEEHQCICDYDFPDGTQWTNGSDSNPPTCPLLQGAFNVTQYIINSLAPLLPLIG